MTATTFVIKESQANEQVSKNNSSFRKFYSQNFKIKDLLKNDSESAIISEFTSDDELESFVLNRSTLKQLHVNHLSTKFPVIDEDKLNKNCENKNFLKIKPREIKQNFESDSSRLSVVEHSIKRRFSALSISMTNEPEDAVKCDCSALATASWARFQRRRKLKSVAAKISTASSTISATSSNNIQTSLLGTELIVSDDSGLASSLSTTSFSAHSLTLSATSSTNSNSLPPKQPNRKSIKRFNSKRLTLSILLGNVVSKMFDTSSKKTEWSSKTIKNLPQLLIEDMVKNKFLIIFKCFLLIF